MKFQTLAQINIYSDKQKFIATVYCADTYDLTSVIYHLFRDAISVHDATTQNHVYTRLSENLDFLVVADTDLALSTVINAIDSVTVCRLSLEQALEQASEMYELEYALSYVRERLFKYDKCFTKDDCKKLLDHIVSDCDDYFTV